MWDDCFDVVVVGGGVMGLGAAYYSARAHKEVLLLEQFDFFNDQSSSKGDSRFFRVMYSDLTLALLAQAADPLWRQLEVDAGMSLRDMNGLLFWGTPAGVNTPEGNLPGCKQTMDTLGIEYEEYSTPGELRTAYPILKELPEECVGLYQADAGVIHAKRTCSALFHLGQELNVTARPNERVDSIVPAQEAGAPVTVVTSRGTYRGRKVILTPGAWTNQLLNALGLQLNLDIWEMTVCHYQMLKPPAEPYPMWFYFGLPVGDDEGTYYSIPPVGDSGRVKVATDFTNHIVHAPSQCTRIPDERILALVKQFVASHVVGLSEDPIPGSAHTCNYTVAPDFGFVLDFLPGSRDIVLFSGEGGQAFKFAPLIGTVLAELALAGVTRYNISSFTMDRPALLGWDTERHRA
jgi:sarcosine oxidase